MDEMVRLDVGDDGESFVEVGKPAGRRGWDVPASLWRDLREAHSAVDRAEMAIVRYIGEHVPEAEGFRDEVARRG